MTQPRVGDAQFAPALLALLGREVTLADDSTVQAVFRRRRAEERTPFAQGAQWTYELVLPTSDRGTLAVKQVVHLSPTEGAEVQSFHVTQLFEDSYGLMTVARLQPHGNS